MTLTTLRSPLGKCFLRPNRWAQLLSDNSASRKLYEDAIREEAAELAALENDKRRPVSDRVVPQYDNWTGDERMEDTVLRMLVDKLSIVKHM